MEHQGLTMSNNCALFSVCTNKTGRQPTQRSTCRLLQRRGFDSHPLSSKSSLCPSSTDRYLWACLHGF